MILNGDLVFDNQKWLKLHEEGTEACSNKRYPQAEVIFAQALKLVQDEIAQKNKARLLEQQEGTEQNDETVDLEKSLEKDIKEKLAFSLNNLAVAYQLQGKYGLALNQYIASTEIYRRLRGEESVDFATSLHNLAIVYAAKGEFDQAENLFKRSLELKEKLLGMTHPDLKAIRTNMAKMLRNAGKMDEAQKIANKA